jgi:murein DD-endopeptidase MepM/ murein hydrolase activator NlpD
MVNIAFNSTFMSHDMHLSQVFVTAGQHVNGGDLIALTGNSGFTFNANGDSTPIVAHLHHGVDSAGIHVNPTGSCQ